VSHVYLGLEQQFSSSLMSSLPSRRHALSGIFPTDVVWLPRICEFVLDNCGSWENAWWLINAQCLVDFSFDPCCLRSDPHVVALAKASFLVARGARALSGVSGNRPDEGVTSVDPLSLSLVPVLKGPEIAARLSVSPDSGYYVFGHWFRDYMTKSSTYPTAQSTYRYFRTCAPSFNSQHNMQQYVTRGWVIRTTVGMGHSSFHIPQNRM